MPSIRTTNNRRRSRDARRRIASQLAHISWHDVSVLLAPPPKRLSDETRRRIAAGMAKFLLPAPAVSGEALKDTPLGSTITIREGAREDTGILVRRDRRDPALPAMLSIRTTPLGDTGRIHSLQFHQTPDVDAGMTVTPPAPGTLLVLSTDCEVTRLYQMGDAAAIEAWLHDVQPIWWRSGDYEIVAVPGAPEEAAS